MKYNILILQVDMDLTINLEGIQMFSCSTRERFLNFLEWILEYLKKKEDENEEQNYPKKQFLSEESDFKYW